MNGRSRLYARGSKVMANKAEVPQQAVESDAITPSADDGNAHYTDTRISDTIVGDLSVEHADEVSVTTIQSQIASNETYVSANQATVSTSETILQANEASITVGTMEQTINNETMITNSNIEQLKIDHSENTIISAQESVISSVEATISAERSKVCATDATSYANEAKISANLLQQACIRDANISATNVEDMSVKHADEVVVSSCQTDIDSNSTSVSANQANISTDEATVVSTDANITADVLHQNITNKTNFTNASVQKVAISTANEAVVSAHEATVLANDAQINANVVQQTFVMRRRTSPRFSFGKGSCTKRFKEIINERSLKQVSGGIADSYKEQKLLEPGFEVNPVLREVKSFYSGEMASRVPQFPEEQSLKLLHETVSVANSITLEELQGILKRGNCRLMTLVGQAGSGKSTLMKRLVRNVLKESRKTTKHSTIFRPISTKQHRPRSSEIDFELVHFLNVRDIPVSKNISVSELLFGKTIPDLSEKVLYYGFKWVLKNQSKVAIFLDGLDQAPWSLLGHHNAMNYQDSSDTSTVMYNILTGSLLPQVRIVLSSREYVIASLPIELRPEKIITLAGLTLEARKSLFSALLGPIGEEKWDNMCTKSPSLVPLCSIPIFLVFNAIVYKACPKDPPDTLSGMIVKVLHILLRSEHTLEHNIIEIFQRLKKMSYIGTIEKRVLFTVEDLTKLGLDTLKVRDLIIKVPSSCGSRIVNQKLLEGDFSFYFCHQSIQEMLAAMYIAEFDLDTFRAFVSHTIHEAHLAVVRRFVCGVLLNRDTYDVASKDLIKVQHNREKQEYLKRTLAERLRRNLDSGDKIEMFASLYESSDSEFIQSHIFDIEFKDEEFNPSKLYAVASVMRRCKHLSKFSLINCNMNAEFFNILSSNLEGTHLSIGTFTIGPLGDTDMESFVLVADIVTHCKVQELVMEPLRYCTLNLESVQRFYMRIANGKMRITQLEISGGGVAQEEAFAFVGSIVQLCKVEVVVISKCKTTTEEIKNLLANLSDAKLRKLVALSGDFHVGYFIAIAQIVTKCEVENLEMEPLRYHHLRAEQISFFYQSIANGKMRIYELDISNNAGLSADRFALVGSVARLCHVKKLTMRDFELEAEGMKSLQQHLGYMKMSKIDIGSTENMTMDCFRVIGDIIKQCRVESLSMESLQYCKLRTKKIQQFCKSVCNGMMQIKTLSVSRNLNMSNDDYAAIGSVVRHCKVKEVRMEDCNLRAAGMRRFLETVGDAKITHLDVGMNRYLGVNGCVSVIGSVIRKCKVEEILLRSCGLKAEELLAFMEAVGDAKIRKLCVDVNRNMGQEGVEIVSLIVRQCRVASISFKACSLNSLQIQSLARSLGDTKVKELGLSRNPHLAEEATATKNLATIAEIVNRCNVEKLLMECSDFTEEQMEMFKETISSKVIVVT